jgi:transposase InsO family protein
MASGDCPESSKLTGFSNYQTWKFRMKMVLLRNNVWQYVDPAGKNVPVPGEPADVAQGRVKALTDIVLSVKEDIYFIIQSCVDPRDAWNKLAARYQTGNNASRLMLKDKLNSIRLHEGGSVSEYLTQLQSIQAELVGIGQQVPEAEVVERMLNSLPPSFDSVYQSFCTNAVLPTFEQVSARLLQDESRNKMRAGLVSGTRDEALALRFPHHNPRSSGFNSRPQLPQVGFRNDRTMCCNWCGRPGHLLRNCRDLAAEIVKRAQARQSSSSSSLNRGHTPRPVHSNVVIEEVDNTIDSEVDVFEVALAGLDIKKDEWLVDSGASRHVSGDRSAFTTLNNLIPGTSSVQTAGNESLPVLGTGSVNLGPSAEININDVYYVPGLTRNLLSVGKIADAGYVLVFDKDKCLVYDGLNNIVGKGMRELDTGLYRYVIEKPSFPICAIQSPVVPLLWHRRLGHLNQQGVRLIGPHRLASGVPLMPGSDRICESCISGKQSRERARRTTERRATRPLALIHADLCGDIKPSSLGGSSYFASFTDDFSRFCFLKFLRRKSDTLEAFKVFKAWIENLLQRQIGGLRSDRGGEFLSNEFSVFLDLHGIGRELTEAYTPRQNGVAERKNRTLLEKGRSMVADARTPKFLWSEVVATANYLTNRSPTRANPSGISPYQRLFGKVPDLSHLRIFGCVAYVHVPDETRTKLDPKTIPCVLTGYSEESKAYRCFNPHTRKILISSDVKFDEHRFWYATSSNPSFPSVSLEPLTSERAAIEVLDPDYALTPSLSRATTTLPSAAEDVPSITGAPARTTAPALFSPNAEADSYRASQPADADHRHAAAAHRHAAVDNRLPPHAAEPSSPRRPAAAPPTDGRPADAPPVDIHTSAAPAAEAQRSPSEPEALDSDEPPLEVRVYTRRSVPVPAPMPAASPRRSSRERGPSMWLRDYASLVETSADLVDAVQHVEEPHSFRQAASHPEWMRAMETELASIERNHTWTLVDLPSGCRPIHAKWVYKLKSGADGTPTYKARLVARGDEQVEGLDYQETFSPVVKWTTMRVLVSMAAQRNWDITHLDVKSAFLNGVLQEEVYLAQPPGFVKPGQEHLVCRLHKSLYGLRQSPRAWNERIDSFLHKVGLKAAVYDPSLYILQDGNFTVFLVIYVDDVMITGSHSSKIQWLIHLLCSTFDMTILGRLNLYLGVQFHVAPDGGILMSHYRYILKCLSDLGLTDCAGALVPMDPGTRLSSDMGAELVDPTYYRMCVGKLLHLQNTRPDIAFAVGLLSRFMTSPQKPHLDAALYVFRYLKAHATYAIHYQRGGELVASGYSDSDFAGDMEERKSTSGFLFSLGTGPISWRSKLQTEVAQSSAEAEYRALSEAGREAQWLRNLFDDMGIQLEGPTVIWCDNQSAIKMAKNPVMHARTKHIERHCHLIRDYVKKGRIRVEFVRSQDQAADGLTKPLSKLRFIEIRNMLHMKKVEEYEGVCMS